MEVQIFAWLGSKRKKMTSKDYSTKQCWILFDWHQSFLIFVRKIISIFGKRVLPSFFRQWINPYWRNSFLLVFFWWGFWKERNYFAQQLTKLVLLLNKKTTLIGSLKNSKPFFKPFLLHNFDLFYQLLEIPWAHIG